MPCHVCFVLVCCLLLFSLFLLCWFVVIYRCFVFVCCSFLFFVCLFVFYIFTVRLVYRVFISYLKLRWMLSLVLCFLLFFPSFSFFPFFPSFFLPFVLLFLSFLSFFLSSFCAMNEVIFVSFLSPSLAGLRRCHCNHYFVSLTTAPLPTLLNFDLDARRFQALQEENESLRNQVQVNLNAALLLLSVAGFCKGTYIHYK